MSPKRILNVDLSYLPKCTEFFFNRFEKIRTCSEFQAKQILVYRGLKHFSPTGFYWFLLYCDSILSLMQECVVRHCTTANIKRRKKLIGDYLMQ